MIAANNNWDLWTPNRMNFPALNVPPTGLTGSEYFRISPYGEDHKVTDTPASVDDLTDNENEADAEQGTPGKTL